MKILITGHRGFVGRETQRLLETEEHTVVGYDLMDGQDIRDKKQFKEYVLQHKPDRILHLAATARFEEADKDPESAFETNANGTRNVAQVAGELHIPLVYSSTGSVYMPVWGKMPMTEDFQARGNSVYGCSKYLGECYVRRFANPWIILRYGHLYGKDKRYHGLVGGFLAKIMVGQKPILFGGKQTNDFAYIKDIASANLKALTSPWDNWQQEYNIGSGVEISAEEAGKVICKYMKWEGGGGIEVIPGRDVDPERFVYNINKAKFMLGFSPRWSFEKGIEDMMKGVDLSASYSDISEAGATKGVIRGLEKKT
jgi:UDP-glucose 4-epimerase